MDIKKTDVFGGIGVLAIQMIANGILYAFQKNNMYLVIGIVFALIVSVFVVIIISLNRKLKKQEEYYNEEIEKLGIDDLKKEKDEVSVKRLEALDKELYDLKSKEQELSSKWKEEKSTLPMVPI